MPTPAIANARRLDEIGFPEFTASLIGSTFDALISANIRQMEAHVEMVKTLAFTLSEYINNTKDDISGDEVLAFLERVLPAYESDADQTSRVYVNSELSDTEAATLTRELAMPAGSEVDDITVAEGEIDQNKLDDIIEAVANRVAANKYSILQEMVKQGILRLVIEDGQLETRLHFSAWDRSSFSRRTSDYRRATSSTRKLGARGPLGTLFAGPSLSKSRNTALSVKTANTSSNSSSGSNINIFGGVKLNFRTDYLPLAEQE